MREVKEDLTGEGEIGREVREDITDHVMALNHEVEIRVMMGYVEKQISDSDAQSVDD